MLDAFGTSLMGRTTPRHLHDIVKAKGAEGSRTSPLAGGPSIWWPPLFSQDRGKSQRIRSSPALNGVAAFIRSLSSRRWGCALADAKMALESARYLSWRACHESISNLQPPTRAR
jgi:hypothetical protein